MRRNKFNYWGHSIDGWYNQFKDRPMRFLKDIGKDYFVLGMRNGYLLKIKFVDILKDRPKTYKERKRCMYCMSGERVRTLVTEGGIRTACLNCRKKYNIIAIIDAHNNGWPKSIQRRKGNG